MNHRLELIGQRIPRRVAVHHAQPYDDQVVTGDDDDELTLVAVGGKGSLRSIGQAGKLVGPGRKAQPEMAAVVAVVGGGSRGSRKIDPTHREDSTSVEVAVAQVQKSEACVVSRRRVKVCPANNGSGLVVLKHRTLHSEWIEELPAQVGPGHLAGRSDRPTRNRSDQDAGSGRIGPVCARFVHKWRLRIERGHVMGPIAVQGARNEAVDTDRFVHVGEARAHVEHVLQGDRTPGIPSTAPGGDRGRGVDVELALADQNADQRIGDALRHRPGLKSRVPPEVLCIALEDDGATADHQQGACVLESAAPDGREQLRDRSHEGRFVDSGGQIGFRPALGGPPHTRSVGRQRNPGEISVGARTGEGSPCHRHRENRGGKRGRPAQGDSSRGESRSSASASASGGRAGSGTGASSPASTFARKRAR